MGQGIRGRLSDMSECRAGDQHPRTAQDRLQAKDMRRQSLRPPQSAASRNWHVRLLRQGRGVRLNGKEANAPAYPTERWVLSDQRGRPAQGRAKIGNALCRSRGARRKGKR